jgi:uncharacterized membrane protein YraQ (UPF0718 family)
MNPLVSVNPSGLGHGHHTPHSTPTARLFVLVQFGFIAALLSLIVFFRHTPEFATLSITFVSIFLEALPFMLLGAAIGGFIEVFVSKTVITRIVPARPLPAILLAAGLGLVFPVCECAIVPVVRRLFSKGLPLGAGIAFLLGGPIVNPLVALSTAVAYGNDPAIAGYRLASGYLIAVVMGLLIDRLFSRKTALVESPEENTRPADDGCSQLPSSPGIIIQIRRALRHGASDFIDVGRFLVFGAFVAGVLQALVARGGLVGLSGSLPLSVLAMMTLALLLSLCSEADAFVAASFRTTLPLTAQMAFMVLGPMLDLKLVAMYFRVFKIRLILVMSLLTVVTVFLCMMAAAWVAK